QIHHPNFKRALDLGAIRDALDEGWKKGRPVLLEIANQHHAATNGGEPLYGRLSTEELWDELLADDRRVYGVASDDAQHLKKTRRELGGGSSHPLVPGLGWVQVEADDTALTAPAICGALEEGRFYS